VANAPKRTAVPATPQTQSREAETEAKSMTRKARGQKTLKRPQTEEKKVHSDLMEFFFFLVS
jgi:hypothetical protein